MNNNDNSIEWVGGAINVMDNDDGAGENGDVCDDDGHNDNTSGSHNDGVNDNTIVAKGNGHDNDNTTDDAHIHNDVTYTYHKQAFTNAITNSPDKPPITINESSQHQYQNGGQIWKIHPPPQHETQET